MYEETEGSERKKLRIPVEKRGCVAFQRRMIEENPSLGVISPTHVREIDRDYFQYDIGKYRSLRERMEEPGTAGLGTESLRRILRQVRLGEEYLLNRENYLLRPDTVFLDDTDQIRLIYVPGEIRKERTFSESMEGVCRFLSQKSEGTEIAALRVMEEKFRESDCNLEDWIRFSCSLNPAASEKPSGSEPDHNRKKELFLFGGIFAVLLVLFWIL